MTDDIETLSSLCIICRNSC